MAETDEAERLDVGKEAEALPVPEVVTDSGKVDTIEREDAVNGVAETLDDSSTESNSFSVQSEALVADIEKIYIAKASSYDAPTRRIHEDHKAAARAERETFKPLYRVEAAPIEVGDTPIDEVRTWLSAGVKAGILKMAPEVDKLSEEVKQLFELPDAPSPFSAMYTTGRAVATMGELVEQARADEPIDEFNTAIFEHRVNGLDMVVAVTMVADGSIKYQFVPAASYTHELEAGASAAEATRVADGFSVTRSADGEYKSNTPSTDDANQWPENVHVGERVKINVNVAKLFEAKLAGGQQAPPLSVGELRLVQGSSTAPISEHKARW